MNFTPFHADAVKIIHARAAVLLALLLVSSTGFSQPKVEPYLALYFSGDAEMYYIGLSHQIGVDIRLNEKWLINGYGHFFSASAFDGKYKIVTAGLMLQYDFGKDIKRWYVAIGLAYQDAKEESQFYNDLIDRSILLPNFRLGYTILTKKYVFHPELFATGPYFSRNSTELFTLPSIGIRVKKRPSTRTIR